MRARRSKKEPRQRPFSPGQRGPARESEGASGSDAGSGKASRWASDDKIVAAVLAIIREEGLDAVTIEGVTARSGVAKTTIYRRYSDRFELLADVLDRLTPSILRSRDFDLSKDGFVALVAGFRKGFEELFGIAAVGRILASDALVNRRWQSRVIFPQVEGLREFMAQGVRRGLFATEIDYDYIVDMIVGAMLVRTALRGELPANWADRVVETLWPLIHHRRGSTARPDGGR